MTIGLDGEQLVEDMESELVRQTVTADIVLAEALGVTGTPTVFLNGRRVPRVCLRNPVFWEAISAELSASASGPEQYKVSREPTRLAASPAIGSTQRGGHER